MSTNGQREIQTQRGVVRFFRDALRYNYRGHWQGRESNSHVEKALLTDWLRRRGVDEKLISCTLAQGMMQQLPTGRVRLL